MRWYRSDCEVNNWYTEATYVKLDEGEWPDVSLVSTTVEASSGNGLVDRLTGDGSYVSGVYRGNAGVVFTSCRMCFSAQEVKSELEKSSSVFLISDRVSGRSRWYKQSYALAIPEMLTFVSRAEKRFAPVKLIAREEKAAGKWVVTGSGKFLLVSRRSEDVDQAYTHARPSVSDRKKAKEAKVYAEAKVHIEGVLAAYDKIEKHFQPKLAACGQSEIRSSFQAVRSFAVFKSRGTVSRESLDTCSSDWERAVLAMFNKAFRLAEGPVYLPRVGEAFDLEGCRKWDLLNAIAAQDSFEARLTTALAIVRTKKKFERALWKAGELYPSYSLSEDHCVYSIADCNYSLCVLNFIRKAKRYAVKRGVPLYDVFSAEAGEKYGLSLRGGGPWEESIREALGHLDAPGVISKLELLHRTEISRMKALRQYVAILNERVKNVRYAGASSE